MTLHLINVSASQYLRGSGRRLEDSTKPLEFLKIGPLVPTASAAANATPAGSAPAPSTPMPPGKVGKVPQVANEGRLPGELIISPGLKDSIRSDLPHTFAAMKFLKSGPA